ncbi:MAG: endonuclease [Paludibacteraceae bacterium]
MKHTTKLLTLFGALLISSSAWAVDASYYTSLDGQSGKELFTAIGTTANTGYNGTITYSGIWEAYKTTDVDASNKIIDIYSACSFTPGDNQCGSYTNVCDCYNREHSVPQNWFGSDVESTTKGVAGTDLFHVYPTDGKVNGMRSNYPYGETSSGTAWGTGKLGTSSFSGYTSQVFEPADEYKGDLARSYFYMITFWGGYKGTNFNQGTYGAVHFTTTYTSEGGYGLTAYSIALLMKWHRQDPVSQKEIDRNNGIQATQGNRNPFIDYPCLAEYLWGDKAGETFSTASCCGSFEANFSVGSDGCTACTTTSDPSAPTITISQPTVNCESVYVGNTGSNTFTVSGSNLTADITLSITGDGFSIDQTTLTQTDGTVAETTITVTFKPTAAGDYSGTITISSDGATTQTVTVKGSGTTGTIGTAPESSKPAIYFGTVVESALTVSGETAKLNLHISDLATNVTVASSDENIFTIETSTGMPQLRPMKRPPALPSH